MSIATLWISANVDAPLEQGLTEQWFPGIALVLVIVIAWGWWRYRHYRHSDHPEKSRTTPPPPEDATRMGWWARRIAQFLFGAWGLTTAVLIFSEDGREMVPVALSTTIVAVLAAGIVFSPRFPWLWGRLFLFGSLVGAIMLASRAQHVFVTLPALLVGVALFVEANERRIVEHRRAQVSGSDSQKSEFTVF